MIKLYSNQNYGRLIFLLAKAFLLYAVLTTHFLYADDKSSDIQTQNGKKNEGIHITSDNLISNNTDDYYEFFGNVRATQGETVITGDSLKIYYKKDLDTNKNLIADEDSIKKIVVNGNVKIIFDNKIAITKNAVYTTETMILILSGPDSKIISGKDSISGEKITLYRADGHITVESGKENRVEAMFYSEQGALN